MSLRSEFIALARSEGANVSALSRRFGISRKTAYKWLGRAEGACADRSRRPQGSPRKIAASTETAVLALRDAHPEWGARKLRRRLSDQGMTGLPAVSTFTAILHRHGRISAAASEAATPWHRFEHAAPNDLWQIDFKGHFAVGENRCHPLTVLDDHSRFNIVLQACVGETYIEVKPHLIAGFRRYGLPLQMACDNGPPWGTCQREDRLTRMGAWLIRLGIDLRHNRPYHPQSNGKDERFHRTLSDSVIKKHAFFNSVHVQAAFDTFRSLYNEERPHDALGLDVPISRYRPSQRTYPETLPDIHYASGDIVRKVDVNGIVHFKTRRFKISRALLGEPVALRPDDKTDGQYHVFYCHKAIRTIDLNQPEIKP